MANASGQPISIRTCSPVRVSLCGIHPGLLHAATEDGNGLSSLRPSSSQEGGGAVKEGGAKTTIGGGGEGEWVQKWDCNDDDDEYDAGNVGRSIQSNACNVAGRLIHLWGALWDYSCTATPLPIHQMLILYLKVV